MFYRTVKKPYDVSRAIDRPFMPSGVLPYGQNRVVRNGPWFGENRTISQGLFNGLINRDHSINVAQQNTVSRARGGGPYWAPLNGGGGGGGE